LKASSWEQDCVLTRLLAGSQSKPLSTKISEQEIIVMDDAINNGNGDGLERPKKRKRGGSNESEPIIISPAEHHQMKTDADVWWHSGDARKLFAPTNLFAGNGAGFQKIVLERIGIMEDANSNHWDNWRKVVYGGDSNNACSCSDIFTICFRSLYLAHDAMKNILENVIEHIASQLTWKQSLINAIHHMNDAHGN